MDFRTSVSNNLRAYAQFRGRSRRSEYWWFSLFYMICIFGASILDSAAIGIFQLQTPYFIFSLMVTLSLLTPFTGLSWRRLHDIGIPGWINIPWLLIWIVLFFYETGTLAFPDTYDDQTFNFLGVLALIGSLPYFLLALIPSSANTNQYGVTPD